MPNYLSVPVNRTTIEEGVVLLGQAELDKLTAEMPLTEAIIEALSTNQLRAEFKARKPATEDDHAVYVSFELAGNVRVADLPF